MGRFVNATVRELFSIQPFVAILGFGCDGKVDGFCHEVQEVGGLRKSKSAD